MLIEHKPIPATLAQKNYIEILANDITFSRIQRNAWISNEIGRDIHYLDELTLDEASVIITGLRQIKYGNEDA